MPVGENYCACPCASVANTSKAKAAKDLDKTIGKI